MRSFCILFIYLLSGCKAVSDEQSQLQYAEALFTPCAVVQDFIVTQTTISNLFSESPFADRPFQKPPFIYLSPEPIWVTHNKNIDEGINKADHTRKLFQDIQPYLTSRMDGPLSEQTVTAYNQAQDATYSFSDCALSSHIHTQESDRLKIKDKSDYNTKLYKQVAEAEKEYYLKSKETGEKQNFKHIKSLRSNILEDRRNYVIINISRIGINREDKQAVLYTQNYCGRLCGAGYYAVLELSDHKWKVVARASIWVS